MNLLTILEVIVPSPDGITETTVEAVKSGASKVGLLGNPMFTLVFYVIFIFGAFYLMSRPQKKREEALRKLQDNLKIGDHIMLHSGLYGTIADISAEVITVEFGTNKGIRIPVNKSAIAGLYQPDFSAVKEVEETPEKKDKKLLKNNKKEENNAEKEKNK